MRSALAMRPGLQGELFSAANMETLRVDFGADPHHPLHSFEGVPPEQLATIELLITGWGSPLVGSAELAAMRALRAIIHAGGTVKAHLDPAVWAREIAVSTAADANAIPVAEFTLAMILLAGKDALWISRASNAGARIDFARIGNYERVVGIIGASRIGRRVIALLEALDFEVLVSDPFLSAAEATALGARKVELDELLTASTIVSIHAPALPATRHLLSASALSLLPDGATLINTARGSLVDEGALLAELRIGRLRAVLDVTEQEPLPLDHELRQLDNVYLTPHIAGALGNELHRLGATAIREAQRFRAGLPFLHAVAAEDLARMA